MKYVIEGNLDGQDVVFQVTNFITILGNQTDNPTEASSVVVKIAEDAWDAIDVDTVPIHPVH